MSWLPLRTDCTDSSDCLPILLSFRFYFLVFPTFYVSFWAHVRIASRIVSTVAFSETGEILWHLFWSCSYSRVARHRREQEKAVSRERLGSERDEHFIDFFSYSLMLYTSTAAARYCRVLAGLLQHTLGCSSLLLIIAAFCSVEVFTVIRPRPSQCRVLPLVITPRNGAE